MWWVRNEESTKQKGKRKKVALQKKFAIFKKYLSNIVTLEVLSN